MTTQFEVELSVLGTVTITMEGETETEVREAIGQELYIRPMDLRDLVLVSVKSVAPVATNEAVKAVPA